MKSLIVAALLMASSTLGISTMASAAARHGNAPPHLVASSFSSSSRLSHTYKNKLNAVRESIATVRKAQQVSAGAAYTYTVKSVPSFPFNVTAGGGATLSADATYPTPNPANPNEKFPVIFFPNSWSCPQQEYIVKINQLAAMGYVCVEYQTRGWFASTGLINTAGPFDRSDGSELIDFILNTYGDAWNIDKNKIAFGGISYGAGISLLMAGHDDRVKTALAFSGWSNLTFSMYQNYSPNAASLDLLVGIAQITGKPGPDLIAMKSNIISHTNMSSAIAYGNDRSPEMYLDVYKQKQKNIFIANNYLDRFFNPQSVANFWSRIDVSNKFLLMSNGGHAAAEMSGIIGLDNHCWTKGTEFLNAVFKGDNNGILTGKRVQFQFGDSMFSNSFLDFDTVPDPYTAITAERQTNMPSFQLSTANGGSIVGINAFSSKEKTTTRGTLRTEAPTATFTNIFADPSASIADLRSTFDHISRKLKFASAAEREAAFATILEHRHTLFPANQPKKDAASSASRNKPSPFLAADPLAASFNYTIKFSLNPTLTQGSMIDDLLRMIGIPVTFNFVFVDRSAALLLISEPLKNTLNLCGFPELRNIKLTARNTQTGLLSTSWQAYFYLYDVNILNTGRIISDGAFTRWSDNVEPIANPDGSYTIPKVEMRAICTTIPASDRIGFGVVLYNDQFTPAEKNLQVTFDYNVGSIHLPFE